MTKKLNDADLKAAQNLKQIWEEYKDANKWANQTVVAEMIGYTQPNFCSYLNGKQKIGMKALIEFSKFFECSPSDIREELKG